MEYKKKMKSTISIAQYLLNEAIVSFIIKVYLLIITIYIFICYFSTLIFHNLFFIKYKIKKRDKFNTNSAKNNDLISLRLSIYLYIYLLA